MTDPEGPIFPLEPRKHCPRGSQEEAPRRGDVEKPGACPSFRRTLSLLLEGGRIKGGGPSLSHQPDLRGSPGLPQPRGQDAKPGGNPGSRRHLVFLIRAGLAWLASLSCLDWLPRGAGGPEVAGCSHRTLSSLAWRWTPEGLFREGGGVKQSVQLPPYRVSGLRNPQTPRVGKPFFGL